ncbi:MAG: hypothetical protein ACRD1C_05810 [Terriglobales bacterium]
MLTNSDRFISAPGARIIYSLEHVCFYELQNDNKVKVRFSNGEAKDLEDEDARQFLAAVSSERLAPGQAA